MNVKDMYVACVLYGIHLYMCGVNAIGNSRNACFIPKTGSIFLPTFYVHLSIDRRISHYPQHPKRKMDIVPLSYNPPVIVNTDVTPTRVRRYFPETWIWLSDSVG